ncbi:MAG TPA: hypothetical protein VIM41_07090 [Gammaproteobacteria bacterium]
MNDIVNINHDDFKCDTSNERVSWGTYKQIGDILAREHQLTATADPLALTKTGSEQNLYEGLGSALTVEGMHEYQCESEQIGKWLSDFGVADVGYGITPRVIVAGPSNRSSSLLQKTHSSSIRHPVVVHGLALIASDSESATTQHGSTSWYLRSPDIREIEMDVEILEVQKRKISVKGRVVRVLKSNKDLNLSSDEITTLNL